MSCVAPGWFPFVLWCVVVSGKQERGGQHEDTGDRDRGAWAGDAGQQAPQGGQGRDGGIAGDRPCGQGAGDSVRLGLVEPVAGEHRVEHAHAGDQAKLDGDDEYDPGSAGADEGQPERPARAQCAGGEHDLVLPEPCDESVDQS